MHFVCRSFVGASGKSSWSQYWENEPDDPLVSARLGHLFGLINLANRPDAGVVGRQLIDQISQIYFESPHSNPKEALSYTFNHLAASLDQVNLSLLVVLGDRVYCQTTGTNFFIILRSTQISLISPAQTSSPISGPVLASDRLFLCTTTFLDQITLPSIKAALSEPSIAAAEENFVSLLYSRPDQSNHAAALIQINPDPSIVSSPNTSQPVLPVTASPFSLSRFTKLFRKIPFFGVKKNVYVASSVAPAISRRRFFRLALAALLLFGLIITSYFGYRRNQQQLKAATFTDLQQQLDQKIASSLALKNLNLNDALTEAQKAKDIFSRLQSLNLRPDEISRYQNLITTLLSQTGSTPDFNPPLLFDLSLILPKPNYRQIRLNSSQLLLLDPSTPRLDRLDLVSKSHQLVSTASNLNQAISVSRQNDFVYALLQDGLYLATKSLLEPKVKFPSDFKPVDFSFWNSALYLLDSAQPSIQKFAPNSTGFSPPQPWLKSGQKLPPNPVSLAINGQVWVLDRSGQITAYDRGIAQKFTTPVSDTSASFSLTTTPDSQYLAFSPNDTTIYVIAKDGQLHAKYSSSRFKFLSLAISDSNQFLYFLASDQKIYVITL